MASARLSPAVINRLAKELRELQLKPEESIKVTFNEENLSEVQAEYEGPVGTPYEGGVFRMKLVLGADFPSAPPKGWFLTKIFHPNVSKEGEICVNVLKRDWKRDMGLRHVLVIVRCLLIEPFPESALNEEAGKLLLENYDDFAKHARLMTSIHAQPAKRPMPLTATGGANAVNSREESAAEKGSPGEDSSLPAVKKPKGVEKSKAQMAKKKSLRRL
ncbi:Ubiquitin-conjugating enzyme E2 S [Coccomyxa sp. Obi]|nr:Ubiquitin-conjugating enzyme E2 S [Coccomyxa sp. Obi]